MFKAPQHPQLGGGGADLGRGRKGVGKISIRIKTVYFLKRAIPGYAADVFVMLELKTKLLYILFLSVSVISLRKVAIYIVLINSLES